MYYCSNESQRNIMNLKEEDCFRDHKTEACYHKFGILTLVPWRKHHLLSNIKFSCIKFLTYSTWFNLTRKMQEITHISLTNGIKLSSSIFWMGKPNVRFGTLHYAIGNKTTRKLCWKLDSSSYWPNKFTSNVRGKTLSNR